MPDAAFSTSEVSAYARDTPALDSSAERKRLRARLFAVFGAMLAAIAIAAGAWWFIEGQRFVSTNDAYVAADSATITPQVEGTIREILVRETMDVRLGDVLVRLDPAESQLALAQAQANFGQARRHVQQRTLGSDQTIAGGTDVDHDPEVLAAKAAIDKAELDLSRSAIRAPFDGVVARKNAQVGQRVSAGQALMMVIPINDAYVEANFKESQLTKVHSGQPVTLTSDLYGSSVVFHGKVEGLSGGTGSAFSVIPAQNATGNWIKVVQRLPVRIALDPRELAEHPLRVGLSMDATIEISR